MRYEVGDIISVHEFHRPEKPFNVRVIMRYDDGDGYMTAQ